MTASKKQPKASRQLSKKAPMKKAEKIDFSDIPETDAAFWAKAELRIPMNKQGVFLRLDPDVLDWFKGKGKGYQTRMNAVLRSYVESQTKGIT